MFKNLLSGGDKLWAIGEHRVKELGVEWSQYECIDCHKEFDDREIFKNEECYEVIE